VRVQVVVKTSDIKGAGTDANVFITLYGEHNGRPLNSGPLPLENSANNWERGRADTLSITAAVGELLYTLLQRCHTLLCHVLVYWHC
jgi:hypothetical protein